MLQNRLFIHFMGSAVIFADYYGEVSAGITQDGGSIDALNAFQEEGTPGSGTIWESLMFSQAVCVPRHIDLSESGQRRTTRLF